MSNNLLVHTIIRVPKEESAFVYFTLESNEGLAFYSTTENSLGEGFRDIVIKTHTSLEKELDHLIEVLGKEMPVEIRLREIIEDTSFAQKEESTKSKFPNTKAVYGPVKSWRFGMSLGIDPIFSTSTCSFNCIYCQLGQIQNITNEVKEYVGTEKVLRDFKELIEKDVPVDVITYSGSGEPSLASNLGEMIDGIRKISPDLPQYILTNATHLLESDVRKSLLKLDKIIVKLDASNEETFKMINRPAEGVTLARVIEGIKLLKTEFKGEIEIQSMFMPINDKHLDDIAKIFKDISPDAVQLNTPKRPYPLSWHRENRGNHELVFDYEVRELKKVEEARALEIQDQLEERTGLKFYSVYR